MSSVVVGTLLCLAMTVTMGGVLSVTLSMGERCEDVGTRTGGLALQVRYCAPAECSSRIAMETFTRCRAPAAVLAPALPPGSGPALPVARESGSPCEPPDVGPGVPVDWCPAAPSVPQVPPVGVAG